MSTARLAGAMSTSLRAVAVTAAYGAVVAGSAAHPRVPSAVPPAPAGRRLSHPPSRPHRPHGGTARKGARDE